MRVKVNDLNSRSTMLESEYSRISIHEDRLAIMLAGNFNETANRIQRKKLVQIEIETKEGAISLVGTTISYNFILSSTFESQADFVVCDNTLLIELSR